MFFKRHHIRHDLAGVRAVRQPVDHRHIRVFGHLKQDAFIKGADHDQIDIARQNAGRVSDGFTVPKLHIRAGQHHRFPTHLTHPNIKGNARARGGFFERSAQPCGPQAVDPRQAWPWAVQRVRPSYGAHWLMMPAERGSVCFVDV